jgi:hypothetical protein
LFKSRFRFLSKLCSFGIFVVVLCPEGRLRDKYAVRRVPRKSDGFAERHSAVICDDCVSCMPALLCVVIKKLENVQIS